MRLPIAVLTALTTTVALAAAPAQAQGYERGSDSITRSVDNYDGRPGGHAFTVKVGTTWREYHNDGYPSLVFGRVTVAANAHKALSCDGRFQRVVGRLILSDGRSARVAAECERDGTMRATKSVRFAFHAPQDCVRCKAAALYKLKYRLVDATGASKWRVAVAR